MRGTIESFDGATGVIVGEGGLRYGFALGDWRGPQAPRRGVSVDFLNSGGVASEVYPTSAGGSGGPGLDVAALQNAPWAAVFAGVILIGGFFPLLSVPEEIVRSVATQIGAATGSGVSFNLSLYGLFPFFLHTVSMPVSPVPGLGNADGGAGLLFFALYLIPALAAWVMIATFTGRTPGRTLKVATGAAALLGLIVTPVLVALVSLMAAGQIAHFGDLLGVWGTRAAPLGAGTLIIMGGGLLLLLDGLNVLGAHPAAAAPASDYTPAPRLVAPPPPPRSAPTSAPAARAPAPSPAPHAPAPGVSTAPPGLTLRPALILSPVIIAGCLLPLFEGEGTAWANSLITAFEPMTRAISAANAAAGDTVGPPSLLYLAFLIPLLAVWMLVSELFNTGGRGASLALRAAAGVACFVVPALVFAVGPHVVTLDYAIPRFSTGAFLILGGGCLILLNAVGLIPTPRAAPR